MTKIYNKKSTEQRRRDLRKNMPKAEWILWSQLRNKQLSDYKFRRQYSIDNYIVDFYCPKAKLAIEIDGDSHFRIGVRPRDNRRQKFIESFNIKFLRFTNLEIYHELENVLHKIKSNLQ